MCFHLKKKKKKEKWVKGRLGGSVGEASAIAWGHDPGVLRSSPASGLRLSGKPASPPACTGPASCSCSLSNKERNKIF